MTTTDMSLRINSNAINDADHGTARELLCITESAVDALSLNRGRSGITNSNQKSDSSFVTRNTADVEILSADSQSSTVSEILRRSTHASAAFRVPASTDFLPHLTESPRLVRIPVKVLREVPLPGDGRFSGSAANSRDNFRSRIPSERELNRMVSMVSDDPAEKNSALQESEKMHSGASELGAAESAKKSLASEVQTADRVMQSGSSPSSCVHPLMAMLDGGYLTQPINTIVADERLSSGDSQSTSMATSASPIEVLARDKQTSEFSCFTEFLIKCCLSQSFMAEHILST